MSWLTERPPRSRRASASHETPQAFGGEEDEADEDDAENERPRVRERAQVVLEQVEEGRAHDGTGEGAGAADDDHHQRLSGQHPEEEIGRGEAGERRVQRAGETAEEGGHDEDEDRVQPGIVAERLRLARVLANGEERGADRRAYERPAQQERD